MNNVSLPREVVNQALEALEYENSWHEILKVNPYASTVDAITDLRAALAQTVQEPVSKMTTHRAIYFMERFKREEKLLGPNEQAALDFVISMLEKQAEPVEPVAWECKAGGLKPLTQRQYDAQTAATKRHYTRIAPPQRKPLTEEEINAEWHKLDGEASALFKRVIRKFARAIERAHGIGEQP